MLFYDREKELKELHKMNGIADKKSVLCVITGVRRVGKTELIKKFFANNKGVYFYADSTKNSQQLLQDFSVTLVSSFNLEKSIKPDSWEDFLRILFESAENKKAVVAFDEFQRFSDIFPGFVQQMQKYFDLNQNKSKLFLIVSGSSIGLLKKMFFEQKAPLFGRAHNTLYLKPFSIKTVLKILEGFGISSIEKQIEFFAFFGGMPKFYVLIRDRKIKNIEQALDELVFSDNAPLRKEVQNIITEEFGKEVISYYGILTAIALGKTKANEIADFIQIKETSLTPYFYDLTELLEAVKKEVPVIEPEFKKSKKARYFLKDNFFRFWFKFVYRNRNKYEIGNYAPIKENLKKEFNAFVGIAFEEICKQAVTELSKKDEFFSFDKIGRWWHKDKEIDIIALNTNTKKINFIECKWQNSKIKLKELIELEEKSRFVEWNKKNRVEGFAFFSKKGFEQKALNYTKHKKNWKLYSLKDLKKMLN